VGFYRVLLTLGWHKGPLWAGTECCWQLDGTEWHCGLLQSVADSRTVQNGIVGWYRLLLIVGQYRVLQVVGRYRVSLWAFTECC